MQSTSTHLLFLLGSFLLFPTLQVFSQAPASQSQIGGKIFILDTQDPSVLKVYNNDSINTSGKAKAVYYKNLEMPSRQTSAFRIENINPLRYNYYLNGQLVTQFMDNTAAAASPEIAGLLPVNDIVSLDVFNSNKVVSNPKQEIDKVKIELKLLQSNAVKLQNELVTLTDSSDKKKTPSLEKLVKKKYDDIDANNNEISDKLSDLNMMLNKLAINSDDINIINTLENSLEEYEGHPVVQEYTKRMIKKINNYAFLEDKLKSIRSGLNGITLLPEKSGNYYERVQQLANSRFNKKFQDNNLLQDLNDIGYPTDKLKIILNSDIPKIVAQQKQELYRIEEYMTDKKISALGNLLTELYLEVGKMLEKNYIDFSREINEIKNYNHITEKKRKELDSIGQNIQSIFNVIQSVKADISVLTEFMQVNNPQSKDLGNTINSLYKGLLNYLKVIDYINDNSTTTKYTLAMHPNGSNVDLVRYTVIREDILTKDKQPYVYDIWLKGGFKIDFSVGIFATGLTDLVYEKKAVIDNTGAPSDTAFSLGRKDHGKYGFAFGGMVNISPRMGVSWCTPGLSLGVAYGDNQNLQFITAGSLSLGKSERILLHAGYVMGMAKVLDNSSINYNGDNHVRGNIANYPIPMIDKFQGKFIFGISYNLSKKNALQAVSGQGLTKYKSTLDGVE